MRSAGGLVCPYGSKRFFVRSSSPNNLSSVIRTKNCQNNLQAILANLS